MKHQKELTCMLRKAGRINGEEKGGDRPWKVGE